MKSLQESLFDNDIIKKDIVMSDVFEISYVGVQNPMLEWLVKNFQYNTQFKDKEKFPIHKYPRHIDKNSVEIQTILSYIDSIPVASFWDSKNFYVDKFEKKLSTILLYKKYVNIPNLSIHATRRFKYDGRLDSVAISLEAKSDKFKSRSKTAELWIVYSPKEL